MRAAEASEKNLPREFDRMSAPVEAAELTGHQDILVRELRRLRDRQNRSGAVDSAMNTSLRIVGLSGATTDRVAMAEDWRSLARSGSNTGDLSQAVAASKRAVLILKTTTNKPLLRSATLELLDLLLRTKRYVEFKHLSEETLIDLRSQADISGQYEIIYRQAGCLTEQGRPADALSLLHLSLRNRASIHNDVLMSKFLFALAKANAHIADWQPAREALDEALRLDPQAIRTSPTLHGLCADIDEGMGDLSAALKCLRRERSAMDSLTSANIAERIARIQVMYDIQGKESALNALNEVNRATSAQLATESRTSHWALIACAGLSVALLVLLSLRGTRASSVRRIRLKNAVIIRKADETETRSTQLERQNLLLSQALVRDGRKHEQTGIPDLFAGNGMQLIELLMRSQMENAPNEELAPALDALHGRLRVLALVNENIGKQGVGGKLNLKAHFASLAGMLLRDKGLSGDTRVDLDIHAEDVFLADLLPLSLLVNELLLLGLTELSSGEAPHWISISLHRLGEHQCELLYSDSAGRLTKDQFHDGSVSADLVQALAKTLDGTLMLLKSEVTTFQLTYRSGAAMELRKAS